MKRNHLSLRRKTSVLPAVAIGALLLSSCAKDGFDEESFNSGVYNTQLETPSADKIEITASVDGSQQTISWPVVYGAGGYHAVLTNVDAAEVVKDTIIDGCSFATARIADTNYELSLTVLGNEANNNAGGEAVIKTFNTFALAIATIPSGTDLNAYFQTNGITTMEGDAVYDLEQGGSYTLSGVLDLGDQSVLLRSMGDNATITCADGACFKLGNGFKLQNVNIDNTGNTANGLLLLTDTPSEALSTESLGYKAAGANQNGYVMTNTVLLKNVNVKNLRKSLVYGNKTNWSITNLIIDGCIVQLDNGDNSSSVINLYGASNGLVRYLNVTNSTFYNLQENSSAYFLRYSNSSNAQPNKIYGTGANATLTLTHCTLANVFTGKDMANNLANTNLITTTMTDNIFYDVFRVYQFVQTNTVRTTTNNYIWWVKTSPQSNDTSRTDSNGNPLCTEADPGFPTMEELSPLDFGAENAGADFTPSGIPADNRAGDPRWLPAN